MKADTPTADAQDAPIPRIGLRPREAAAAIGIGTRLLWEMTNRGEIPHVQLGRCIIYPADLLAKWLRDRASGGQIE